MLFDRGIISSRFEYFREIVDEMFPETLPHSRLVREGTPQNSASSMCMSTVVVDAGLRVAQGDVKDCVTGT